MGDVEYLLLREKGPYHDVYVRRRLNTNPGLCKFYSIVISVVSVCLVVLLLSLVYIFVLVPSWQEHVLTWDTHRAHVPHTHVFTHTQCGTVEGVVEDGVFVFKGIPYALPATGARRWDSPRKLEGSACWRGIYQAKRFRDVCTQPGYNSTTVVGSEDCLFLNVWTQHLDPSDSLPVMVWIYGGYLLFGSGSTPPFCPTTELTKSTGAVFVSMNYRLGAMGFLALDVLSQSSTRGTSGNYGLMDIALALQWVRENIRNFGGNPDMVTVFGQRAGGTAIQALLVSPLARGLFQRAWLTSPSLIPNRTSAQASQDNEEVLYLTGCTDASCLRNLSAAEVMQKIPWATFPSQAKVDPQKKLQELFTDYHLVVDGYVLKQTPLLAWTQRPGLDVPLVFTTTTHNTEFGPPYTTAKRPTTNPITTTTTATTTTIPWTWEHYTTVVRTALRSFPPSVAERALLLYPATSAVTPEQQFARMTSDVCVTCPVQILTNATSSMFHSPVFRAVITAVPSVPFANILFNDSQHRLASYTGDWSLLAFFGDFDSFGFRPTRADVAFQRLMRREIMAFARQGKPEASVWETAQDCTALLSDHVFPLRSYDKERCEFWLANSVYSSYAGI